jgi:flap endonuclease-1
MGIKQLTKLISELCPGCIREQELKQLTGRKIAIDASMAIYQFLVRVSASQYVQCVGALQGSVAARFPAR